MRPDERDRVDAYCKVLWQWLNLITSEPALSGSSGDAFRKIAEVKPALTLAIRKSNYLFRRLYGGEEHRTEPCGLHKGQWSGYAGDDSRICPNGCSNGIYDVTGWLPNNIETCPTCFHIAQQHVSTVSIATGERVVGYYCAIAGCACRDGYFWTAKDNPTNTSS